MKILTFAQQWLCGKVMSPATMKILTFAQQWLCGKVMSPATIKILTFAQQWICGKVVTCNNENIDFCTTMALWQSYATCNNENIGFCTTMVLWQSCHLQQWKYWMLHNNGFGAKLCHLQQWKYWLLHNNSFVAKLSPATMKILTFAQQWLCGKVVTCNNENIDFCTTMDLWQSCHLQQWKYWLLHNSGFAAKLSPATMKILTFAQQWICGKVMSPATMKILTLAQQCICGKLMSPATIKRYVGLNVRCLILQ